MLALVKYELSSSESCPLTIVPDTTEITKAFDERSFMEELLESTETAKLKDQFQKYLPSVLNEEVRRDKKTLVEGVQSQKTVVTGDKSAPAVESVVSEETATIQQLRKLAGIQR